MTERTDADDLDQVLAAYLEAAAAGAPADRAALLSGRPELAADLEQFFADHDGVEELTRPLRHAALAVALAEAKTIDYSGPAPEPAGVRGAPFLPGYEVMEEIGSGGMGVVYKARRPQLDRVVALKRVRAEDLRSLQEARIMANLDHPNIVRIHDLLNAEGQVYLCLEYMEGGDLNRAVGGRPPSNERAAEIMEVLARAVQYAHDHGVIHRDLKPANILLTAAGAPKVSDFGLARRARGDVRLTHPALPFWGTPQYMAPEQATPGAVIGPAADVYGLGGVLYYLLTGRPPFDGPSRTVVAISVLADDPAPPRSLNKAAAPELEEICLKCLRKAPGDRYGSAGRLAEALAAYRAGPARPQARGPWSGRLRWLGAAAVAVLTVAVLLAWTWRPAPAALPAPARKTLTPGDVLAGIAADLRQTAPAERPSRRYLTLAHLYNNPKLSDADLAAFRRLVDDFGRRLDAGGQASALRPVGSTQAVYVTALDRLGWGDEDWRRLVNKYPYGLSYDDTEGELKGLDKEVQDLAGGRLRYVRADWFVQAVVGLPAGIDGGPPVAPGPWPESAEALARRYPDQTLDLDGAAAELGLSSPSRILEILKTPPKALQGLAPLREGGFVRRAAWESQEFRSSPYQRLSQKLGLGAPSLSD